MRTIVRTGKMAAVIVLPSLGGCITKGNWLFRDKLDWPANLMMLLFWGVVAAVLILRR